MVLRRGVHPILVADAYREVGQRLGLVVDTRGTWIRGVLGGRRLWFGDVLEAGDQRRYTEIRGILSFERPLGLGLYARPRGRADRLYRRVRSREQTPTDKAFGARFQVFGDDPEAVSAVLDDEARARIVALLQLVPDIVVTDEALFAFLRRAPTKAETLGRLLDAMAEVCAAIERRRDDVTSAVDLDWGPLAERLGLRLTGRPALTGTILGRAVDVVPARESDGHATWIRVAFPDPKENGFILRTQRIHDDPWTAGQDIETGNAEFDAAFVIKGYDPQAVIARTTNAQAALLELQRRGTITADDYGLELRGGPVDPAALEATIREACAVAEALGY